MSSTTPSLATQHVDIGPELGVLLDVARAADLPVLVTGRHGIGKSQYVAAWAEARGLRSSVLDLSLLEATDLTGLPFARDGRTHFAPPAHLPTDDDGAPWVLVLEELNRCDRSVRQPCLQLLTARRLNDYVLPRRCFMVGCVNPVEDGYDVDELDDALRSRFIQLAVRADRRVWGEWAKGQALDAGVVAFVERHAQAFEVAPPRSWEYAARLLVQAREARASAGATELAIGAVLGPVAAHQLLAEVGLGGQFLPTPAEILAQPEAYIVTLRELTASGRLDVVKAILDELDAYLCGDEGGSSLVSADMRLALARLVREAPPDLRREVEGHFRREASQP